MTARFAARLCAAAALSAISLVSIAHAAETAVPEGIVILHSNQRPLPAGIIIDDTLRRVVSREMGRPVEFFSEFLDSERFAAPEYIEAQAAFLHNKYADRNVRVIVAVVPQAFQFVLDHRPQILPGVPVVHLSMPRDLLPEGGLPPEFVGKSIDLDPTDTFALALRLQPQARHLVIVAGSGERDRVWERRIRNAVGRLGDRVETEYLMGLPTAELVARLGALSGDTIVYTPGYFADGTGHVITPRQSAQQIAAASKAPVYGPYDTFLDTGVVGGAMSPYQDQAEQAAAIVVRLLNGAAPTEIAPSSMPNVPIVDWRQIRRWGIDERLLPSNAIVKFRAPTVWEAYWREISFGITLLALQTALIAALLVERRRRRWTATALAESQKQMNLAARAARISLWIWDVARDRIWATARLPQHAGLPKEHAVAFNDVLDAAHPADREVLEQAVRKALASGEELDVQYRVTEPGGGVRWIAARGRVEQGSSQRLLGVALDITERKLSELRTEHDRSALRHMTRVSMLGQLSAAIAHQLNQPLAAILGNAEAAQKMLGREPVDLAELRAICNDIVSEDHRASEVIRRLGELYKRSDMKMELVDLNELIRETLDLVRAELLTRHVMPVMDLATAVPAIEGGRIQLQQVLLNLILNASEAMLDVEAARRTLTLRSELAGANVRVSVVDRGSGIAEGDLKNLFGAFWSTKERGMGVGLTVCQSIVVAHHGTITVLNNPEGGATFCIQLPITQHA